MKGFQSLAAEQFTKWGAQIVQVKNGIGGGTIFKVRWPDFFGSREWRINAGRRACATEQDGQKSGGAMPPSLKSGGATGPPVPPPMQNGLLAPTKRAQ